MISELTPGGARVVAFFQLRQISMEQILQHLDLRSQQIAQPPCDQRIRQVDPLAVRKARAVARARPRASSRHAQRPFRKSRPARMGAVPAHLESPGTECPWP